MLVLLGFAVGATGNVIADKPELTNAQGPPEITCWEERPTGGLLPFPDVITTPGSQEHVEAQRNGYYCRPFIVRR